MSFKIGLEAPSSLFTAIILTVVLVVLRTIECMIRKKKISFDDVLSFATTLSLGLCAVGLQNEDYFQIKPSITMGLSLILMICLAFFPRNAFVLIFNPQLNMLYQNQMLKKCHLFSIAAFFAFLAILNYYLILHVSDTAWLLTVVIGFPAMKILMAVAVMIDVARKHENIQ